MRLSCAALLVGLGACGGGGDGAPAAPSTSRVEAHTAGVVLTIDATENGVPVGLSAALGENGDGFVVWRASDGTRHNLWASRYRAATGAWSPPEPIEDSSQDIGEGFFLTVDAGGNAVVVWRESTSRLSSARFDAGAGAWSPPQYVGAADGSFSASANAAGVVHIVGANGGGLVFDPVDGTWQPTGYFAYVMAGTGYTFDELVATDEGGGALALFHYGRTGVEWLGSNYFSRDTGRWDQLPPDAEEGTVIGAVPDSVVFSDGGISNLQAVASGRDSFLAAWQVWDSGYNRTGDIRIARYASPGRSWTTAKTVVPESAEQRSVFQRLGSRGGSSLLLWTQDDGTRTALRALRLDENGIGCDDVRTIDGPLGGGAARADIAIDTKGDAIAVWEQFEGGRADDGSRSNIAFSRFDATSGSWLPATLAETTPGNAVSPRASAAAGTALLGWIQSEGGSDRVKVLVQPLSPSSAP